jgi:hypothetical protein
VEILRKVEEFDWKAIGEQRIRLISNFLK